MTKHRVLINGKLESGFEEALVKQNFSERFKINDAAQLEKIFSGKRVEIKSGLDSDGARRLQEVLSGLGLVAVIDPPLETEDKTLATVFEKLPDSGNESPEEDETLATVFDKLPDSESRNPEDETLATVFDKLPDENVDETLATAFNQLPEGGEDDEAETGAETKSPESESSVGGEISEPDRITQSVKSDAIAMAAATAEQEQIEMTQSSRFPVSPALMLGGAALLVVIVVMLVVFFA